MLFAAVLSACSGGAGGGLVPHAPLAGTPAVQPLSSLGSGASFGTNGSRTAAVSTLFTLAGPIANFIRGGFTIQAGGSVGYIHILTNASTVKSGKTPAVGTYEIVTGTGSPATTMQATYVATFASKPAKSTFAGKVAGTTAYGFTLHTSPANPDVPVVVDGQTSLNVDVAPGRSVEVTGQGTPSVTVVASRVAAGTSGGPTPPPTAMTHLLTADYLGGVDGGTHKIAWSQAAPYLTWAQTSPDDANGIHAAGIKTQYYIDPNRLSVGDTIYPTNNEAAFAHDCSNKRVSDQYHSITQYIGSVGGAALQGVFANYIKEVAADSHIDAIFEDDAGPLSAYTPYWPFSGMPCGYTDATWLANGIALNQSSSLPIVFNGLSGLNGHNVAKAMGLFASTNTIGGMYEGCYTSDDEPAMTGWEWVAIENTELQVAAKNKQFYCMLKNTGSSASQTAARLYGLASFLLTYSPSTSVLWEDFATSSGLHVEPESQLVPENPVVPAPSAIGKLKEAGGAYGREYANCYYAGTSVGRCAVVVNPDASSAHPFPFQGYTHTLVVAGDGILDGGTASVDGPAPSANVPARGAVIAF